MGRSGGTLYFRAERIVGHQDGHPPALRSGGGTPAGLALPKLPTSARVFCLLRQHLQAPSDIAGSGGAPRQATAWDTEARSVAFLFAGIVNTEGPRL